MLTTLESSSNGLDLAGNRSNLGSLSPSISVLANSHHPRAPPPHRLVAAVSSLSSSAPRRSRRPSLSLCLSPARRLR
ncbi:hypothetical protein Dimus_038099 [Dionaea muscipula]